MRRTGLLALAVGVVATLASAGASAGSMRTAGEAASGPASGLCKMDASRGAVPATFPVDGCVDGGGVWIHDDRPIPIRLYLTGDTGTPRTVRAANATLAADAMWASQGKRDTLLAPGQTSFVPVGNAKATVSVVTDTAATNTYVIADGLVSLIGASKLDDVKAVSGATKADSGAAFVAELTDVFQKFQNCLGVKPSIVTRAKCGALLDRDVTFATTRLGLKMGPKVVGLVIDAIKTWKLTLTVNGVLNAIESSEHTISLTAIAGGSSAPVSNSKQMNLKQIAEGNYTSLLGTWVEEAYAVNPQDGTGEHWRYTGGTGTLSISNKRIVTNAVKIQGSTLTSVSANGPISNALSFRDKGKYLEATLANQNVSINWAIGFYPERTMDLNSHLGANNGVTLDRSKNTIYIWTSNNGYTDVFTQVVAAPSNAPDCLTTAEFTRLLATSGVTVNDIIYCGGGWAATGTANCNNGGCDAGNTVFHVVDSRWTVSSKDAVCDYAHNGANSPFPSKIQWFCQGG